MANTGDYIRAAGHRAKLNDATAMREAQAIVHRIRQENPDATDGELEKLLREDATLRVIGVPDGNVTEDWICVDCGINTAPGFPDGPTTLRQIEATGESTVTIGGDNEVYMVRESIWKKVGMEPFGGCLCIGCLEKRLGRKLKPKDFPAHPFNGMPGSPRLLKRRKYWHVEG
jgi:hypothetical protein